MPDSPSIPAPGFRTYQNRNRPYLPSEAVHAVRQLADNGVVVPLQAVGLLTVLCDKVSAEHGQFYGSWENLIASFGWSRQVWFRWLARLEELGLVENLGYLEGRRTTTWQILPDLYRLVSLSQYTSEDDTESPDVYREEDTNSLASDTPLVSRSRDSLVSREEDTNIRTSKNIGEEHPLTGDASHRDESDIESRRQDTIRRLAEYSHTIEGERDGGEESSS